MNRLNKLKALWTLLLLSIATAAGAQTYYNVIFETPTGGNVSGVLTAQAGETVTLTVTPETDKYIEAGDIIVIRSGNVAQAPTRDGGIGLGERQEVTAGDITPEGQGTFTFEMPAWNVTVSATFHDRTDISTSAVITLGNDDGGSAAPYTIDGAEHKPAVASVTVGGSTLTAEDGESTVNKMREYEVAYLMADYASCGLKEVSVRGRGKYMGMAMQTFNIVAKSINEDDGSGGKTAASYLTVTPPDGLVYNTRQQNAAFTIVDTQRNYTLVQNVDYTLTGHEQVEAGTYEVTITGIGDYGSGATEADRQFTAQFTIAQLDLASTTMTLSETTFEYNGTDREPTATVTITVAGTDDEGNPTSEVVTLPVTDYSTTYANNLLATVSTAPTTATINGKDPNTTGSQTLPFTITKHALTITAHDQTLIYGSSISTGTGEATPTGLISIYLDNGDDNPDNDVFTHVFSGITLTPSTDQATTSGSITPSAAVITDEKGNDVASSYDITYVDGSLTINPKDYASGDLIITGLEENYVYTGQLISPELTINNKEINELMELGRDYDVEYTENLNVGTATVTVTFKGNYSGTTTRNYEITKRPVTITAKPQTLIYGTPITEGVEMTEQENLAEGHSLTAITLTPSTDQQTTEGTITPSAATISDAAGGDATSNYEITYTDGLLTINAKDYESGDLDIAGIEESYEYTGSEISPEITITNKETGEAMELERDYDVEYTENINAGTATVTVTFKGNYSGATTRTFAITQKPVTITAHPQTVVYGTPIDPSVAQASAEGLVSGHTVTAITLTPSTDQQTTNGTVTPSAATISDAQGTDMTANYAITYADGLLTILQKASDNLTVEAIDSYVYSGQPIEPKPVVKDLDQVITEGTDYELTYQNNQDVGTATVIITFRGNYSGALAPTFAITQRPATITATGQTVTFGTPIVTSPAQASAEGLVSGHTVTAITLTPSTDQQTADGTVTPSAATISDAQGRDVTTNYAITYVEGPLTILQKAGEGLTVEPIGSLIYSGEPIEPKPVVKDGETVLAEGTDYELSYQNNVTVGTATVTVRLKGNYSGGLSPTFTIAPRPVTITAHAQTIVYGTAIDTSIAKSSAEGLVSGHSVTAITLTPSTDQQTDAGTITPSAATVSDAQGTDMTANYAITYATGQLTILKKAGDNLTADIESENMVYNGQPIEPKVTVKDGDRELVEGEDYDVRYEDNEDAGTGKAVIIFKGNYDGGLTPTFTIAPRPVTITALPQSIGYGSAIAQSPSRTSAEGLVSGHTVTAITLTPSTDQLTADGTITPSAATISDAQGRNVTQNYVVSYVDGLLVITESIMEQDGAKVIIDYDEDGTPEGRVIDVDDDQPSVVIPGTVIGPDGKEIPVKVIDPDAFKGKEDIHDIYLTPKYEIEIIDPTFGGWATPEKGARVHVYQTLLKTYAEGQLKALVEAGLLVTDIENVNRLFTFSNAFSTILPEGVRQHTCYVEDNGVHMHEVLSDVIDRETGVLLVGNPGLHIFVATTRENGSALYNGNELRPVMESEHISSVDLAYLLTVNEFKKMNLNNSIPDGKAYLQWPDPQTYEAAPARLQIVGEGTGIDSIDNGQRTIDNWYDMMGNRIEKPLRKGVYIRNGRKIVVK